MDPRAYVYVGLSGEQVRGGPGCVFVDSAAGSAKYLLLTELYSEQIRLKMTEMMQEDEQHIYILHKEESNVHIFKYPRKMAQEQAMSMPQLP